MPIQLRARFLVVFLLVAISSTTQAASYTGAWFKVWYPDSFRAVPSIPSRTSGDGVDSAFFRSPDGQVEFYIFSPQWNGEPSDIAIDPARETVRAKETKPSGDGQVTWITLDANDGSYARSYQDTVSNGGSVRWVVGIKYSSQAAYNRYKSSYLKFKRSLEQYADGLE
ncbi:hypothetical protein [Thiorhodovibrio frisius]|uniref:Uncharacterized protein n=1 Tax=Thiorhodovibrio frisius TaxID=631362 RepID=H8Z7B7_9GAMM|nr:hypothetical protein [Thiorhodovibrio frisius]EIC19833.1 hypothetical protein Thi970DRAFT_03437 [Thiorhodovibrio frisius]WPL20561.1 hypothetical protein Thiofri_00660 [Thiorhodovibrio frisius]